MFLFEEDCFAAALREKPAAIALAWPRPEQDLKHYIDRAHDAGCKVSLMAGGVPEAERGAAAGADIIVAQGTEGGGHVGWMASIVLTPMVVDAVAPVPVLTAGGIADGRGLAAALALGADGVLLGTRFLASREAPMHENFKQAIVDSNGHDTVLTGISRYRRRRRLARCDDARQAQCFHWALGRTRMGAASAPNRGVRGRSSCIPDRRCE